MFEDDSHELERDTLMSELHARMKSYDDNLYLTYSDMADDDDSDGTDEGLEHSDNDEESKRQLSPVCTTSVQSDQQHF